MNQTGTRPVNNRRWVAVGLIIGLSALGLAAATGLRASPAGATPPPGVAPVAYVGSNGQTFGVGAFPTNALSTQAGLIGFGSTNRPVSEVAITPNDRQVVAIAGATMSITPVSPPSYVAPTAPAPVLLTFNQFVQPAVAARGLAISPDGHFAYTILSFDSDPQVVVQVNLASHAVSVLSPDQRQADFTTLAVSPDGRTVFLGGSVSNCDGFCAYVSSLPVVPTGTSGTWTSPLGPEGSVESVDAIAVTPDGSQLYAVGTFGTEAIGTVPAEGVFPGAPIDSSINSPGSVVITPDGTRVYVGGRGLGLATFPVVAVASPQPTGTSVAVPVEARRSGITRLAITPDTSEVIGTTVAITNTGVVLPDLVSVPLAGDLPSGVGIDHTGPAGQRYTDIAVTPDLAPVAQLASSPATPTAGQTVTIDASGSSVAFGKISGYQWSTSDGSCNPSSGPTLLCTFGAGTSTVTVRETDSAGTSTVAALHPGVGGVDFTGRTVSRAANDAAATSIPVTVLPLGTVPTTSTTTTTVGTHTTTTSSNGTTTSTSTTSSSTSTSTSTSTPDHTGPGVPKLMLNPGVGPPGTIVIVTGTGFKANTPVTVSWSTSTGSVVIVANAHGDLPPTPLPVLTPDVLGPRYAVAAGRPSAPPAPFLVVPSDSEPGGGGSDFLFRSEGP